MLALLFALLLGAQNVTLDDVQRIQDTVNHVADDFDRLRQTDGALAGQLDRQLDDVRDDLGYLRVRLRRNESIDRREYADIRDHLEDIRARARGENVRNADGLPVGTEFDIRLQTSLSSRTAQVEDRFDATTVSDLRDRDGRLVVPAGAVLRGFVSSVNKAGHIDRTGSLTLAFDRITIDGRTYDLRATVIDRTSASGKGEAAKVGAGALVGGIIGGLLGGGKGAVAGVLIGGGGTMAATEGKDVDLRAGTILGVRLDTPLDLTRPSFN